MRLARRNHHDPRAVGPSSITPVTLALFRVLQEATVNAAVHSKAAAVRVSLRGAAGKVCLEVVDRGVGFDPQRVVPGAGVGLVAIRERLRLVNGESLIVSRPGEGTRIEAWVALPISRADSSLDPGAAIE